MSRGLKRIARAFDIPVLALSQLTRPKNGGVEEPQLHELKESSQLEADADHVLFLWHKNEPREGDTVREIAWKVGKNRDGIYNRGVLDFEVKYCRFREAGSSESKVA